MYGYEQGTRFYDLSSHWHVTANWIRMWVTGCISWRQAWVGSDGDMPLRVSELHVRSWSALILCRGMGTEWLSQPVNRGQSAAQGTILSERNQTEVLATLSFKDPLWLVSQSKKVNPGLGSLPAQGLRGSSSPGATALVQDISLIKSSSTREGSSGQPFASILLHHLLKVCM